MALTPPLLAVDGVTLQYKTRHHLITATYIMVFQEFDQLLPWKSVRENVAFPLIAARALPRREAREKAMAAIAKVNLTTFAGCFTRGRDRAQVGDAA